MSNVIGWHHPTDDSDQWDGFNEPGIEHFRGSPVKHLAREVIQNALDASDDINKAVSVRIKLNKISTEQIPNIDEFRDIVHHCSLGASKEGVKAESFFKAAKEELKKKEISVLEISDFNTLGMRGPSENGTPFYAFMKAKGQSVKDSKTAGGSYGIGKFAPYAVSKLRTVFVSSISKSIDGELTQLTQGRSILMSHDVGVERKQGLGFWGIKSRCQPIVNFDVTLPGWLARDKEQKTGTKLSILCFDEPKNWQKLLTMSVMENFFGAINDGKLVVNIDDQYRLDATTIDEYFNEKNITNEFNVGDLEKEDIERFNNRYNYLKALKSNLTESSQTATLGYCDLKILLGENLPKKVCILRNGMFISESIAGLKSFSDFKEFSAVFTCGSEAGNGLLRAMEPPRHDDFEPELLLDKAEKIKGKKALKEIATMVRKALERHAKDPVSEITSIDELKEFFGDENESGGGKNNEEADPLGNIIIRAKQMKSKSLASTKAGLDAGLGLDDGDLGGDDDAEHHGSTVTQPDNPKQKGAGDNPTKSLVALQNIRAIMQSGKSRKVFFTPTKAGMIQLKMLQVGADAEYVVAIHNTSVGLLKDAGVALEVIKGQRVEIEISMKQEYLGALKVVAYEI
ncbi:MAG: hypothetical protein HOO85_11550 [Methylotenera sp.]|nr:hypothetical protein [Methylotenera sp.]